MAGETMSRKSIILIGMPGCGKSTIGVLLAKAVCMGFMDTDLLIQDREKMPLQQLINRRGNGYFAECENQAVLSIRQRSMVIATGGSVVLHPAAMEHLRSLGRIVYLDVAYPEIKRRLWNLKTRGIVLEHGQTLEDLYLQRKPYYEKYADFVIRAGRMKTEKVVQMIVDQLGLTRCDT
jgi:shikimate kinase